MTCRTLGQEQGAARRDGIPSRAVEKINLVRQGKMETARAKTFLMPLVQIMNGGDGAR